jgi:hypothetical protein
MKNSLILFIIWGTLSSVFSATVATVTILLTITIGLTSGEIEKLEKVQYDLLDRLVSISVSAFIIICTYGENRILAAVYLVTDIVTRIYYIKSKK